MKTNNYMSDRLMVSMLRQIAKQRDITFSSLSDDWIIELRKDDTTHRVIGYRFDMNNSVASQLAQDKVATYVMLTANAIPSIQHRVIRQELSYEDWDQLQAWGQVVMKPLTGSGGHDVRLFDDMHVLSGFVRSSPIHAWAASPLAPIDSEARIILLDGEVLLAYIKRPVVLKGIAMFNLGLGGEAVSVEPSAEEIQMARQAQAALGLRLCAVDLVQGKELPLSVLEVNDAFGMEHYARASGENKDQVMGVYGKIIDRLFTSETF